MNPYDPINDPRNIEKSSKKLIVFEDKKIRRIFHRGEWYFSIIDIVEALAESSIPRRYWSDLKRQLAENKGFSQLYEKIVQLKLESSDGNKYLTDTANTETMFRIIQSIPSPKQNLLKDGLQKLDMNELRRSKILSLRLNVPVKSTKKKDTAPIGLKSECEALQFEKN